MHFEILVEEPSAQVALETLLPRLLGPDHTWHTHNFRDKQTLLRELPKRLKGYAHWIPPDWRIVVLIDEDRQNCLELKAQLDQAAQAAGLSDCVLNRIAVEELEAWWFGDIPALRAVYPRLPATLDKRSPYRDPDAISGGTWEALDRELRRAGYKAGLGSSRILIVPDALAGLPNPAVPRTGCWRFQLLLAWICNPGRAEWDSYFSGTALLKIETARQVAVHLDLEHNRSRSFQVFRSSLLKLAGACP